MAVVTVREAKTNLSKLIAEVIAGGDVAGDDALGRDAHALIEDEQDDVFVRL